LINRRFAGATLTPPNSTEPRAQPTAPRSTHGATRRPCVDVDPFLALANEIERNPWWVDSSGEWELRPEENDEPLTPAAAARKPTLASIVKQARKAGIDPARIEIKPDGGYVVVTGKGEQQQGNELDEWIAKHARATEGNS
jgi:hypothetical protein